MSEADCSVSIVLLCFRDAPYIRAAIESALAQTVPCEIVISNDASDDGTWELAREAVAGYRGPHRVSLRRNEHNLGVAGHLNAVLPLTHGEIIVMMAGDDTSRPHRVREVLDAFARFPAAMALDSAVEPVDQAGHPAAARVRERPEVTGLDYFVHIGRLTSLLGASLAFRRPVFDRFGPLSGPIEDNALSLRAALLGDCVHLREPLVRYRQHAGSVSADTFARHEPPAVRRRLRYERTIRFYRGTAEDLARCLEQLPELPPRKRALARHVLAMYRIEADAREALLNKARRHWLKPIARGLLQIGLRRKSAERALKLLLPRGWLGLDAG